MDSKKIIIVVLLIQIIISDIFLVFGKEIVGPYIVIFAMLAIISGIGLIIMVIISRKKENVKIDKQNEKFDFLKEDKIEKKICPICKTENKENAKYCLKCGSDLKDVVCPICQTVNSFDQKYCTNCDTILQNVKRH